MFYSDYVEIAVEILSDEDLRRLSTDIRPHRFVREVMERIFIAEVKHPNALPFNSNYLDLKSETVIQLEAINGNFGHCIFDPEIN